MSAFSPPLVTASDPNWDNLTMATLAPDGMFSCVCDHIVEADLCSVETQAPSPLSNRRRNASLNNSNGCYIVALSVATTARGRQTVHSSRRATHEKCNRTGNFNFGAPSSDRTYGHRDNAGRHPPYFGNDNFPHSIAPLIKPPTVFQPQHTYTSFPYSQHAFHNNRA